MTENSPLSPHVALGLLVACVAIVNIVRSVVVPNDWHFLLNVSLGLVSVAIAALGGMGVGEMGLSSTDLASGLRLGGIAFAAVSAVVISGGLLGLVADDRTHMSMTSMLLKVLIVIPIGTVIVEELLFRSALHGLLMRLWPGWPAVVIGSLLFGLWHVFPASQGDAVSTDAVEVGSLLTVLATFVATSIAGGLFIWMRERSNSVVAPMLAHLATNSVTFYVAWLFGAR